MRVLQRAGLFCLLALFAVSAPTADAAGLRTSASGTILSVGSKAKSFTFRTKIRGQNMDVEAETPRANYIYYRWNGTLEELSRGDKVEVAGTFSEDETRVTASRIGLFKGMYARGGDAIFKGDNGSVTIRGKLALSDGTWCARANGDEFPIEFPKDVQVLIHDDFSAKQLKKGQRISLTGTLEDGRMSRLSQLYVNEKNPNYKPETGMARGGKRLFEGKAYLIDTDLDLFVGSGTLDGQAVPLSVRWVEQTPHVYVLRKASPADLKPGQRVLMPQKKVKNADSVLFVFSDSDKNAPDFAGLSSYKELVAGTTVADNGSISVKTAGNGTPVTIATQTTILLAEKAGLESVRVGQTFVAIGAIPDDGSWLLNNPEAVLLFNNDESL